MKPLESRAGRKPDLIIFDFDGVIADSETLANQVLADRLTALGYNTTLEDAFEHYLGRNWTDCLRAFEALWGCEAPRDLRREIDFEINRRLPDLQPVVGAVEFVKQTSVVPRCIASSSDPDWITRRLALFGLAESFEGMIFSAAVHVKCGKPHPDIYLHALKAMGAAPDRTWVIEDSVTGVNAAVASGANVIGLCAAAHCRDGHGGRLLQSGATIICQSFEEVAAVLALTEL